MQLLYVSLAAVVIKILACSNVSVLFVHRLLNFFNLTFICSFDIQVQL